MSNKVKVVVNEEKISETPTVLVGASDKPDQLSPNPAHSGFTKQLFVDSLPDTGEPNVIYCVAIKTGLEQAIVGYRNYKWDLEQKKFVRVFDNDPALKILQGPQGVEVNEVNPPKKAPEKVFEGEVIFKEEPIIKGKKLSDWVDSEGGVTQEELDAALALKQDKLDTESAPSGVVTKLLGFDSEGNVVSDDVPEGIVVDDSLDTESNNAIANKPVAEKFAQVDETLEQKANVDGNYPTMTVGVADQLSPYDENSGDDQDTPFTLQATGTGNGSQPDFATGAIALLKEKQGNTVVVNQWSRMRNSGSGAGLTFTKNNDGTLSISGTYDGTVTYNQVVLDTSNFTLKANHKYLIFKNKAISCSWGMTGFGAKNGNVNAYIFSHTVDFVIAAMIKPNENDVISIDSLIVYAVDLTQWFNGDIPQDLLDNPDHFFRYYNGSLVYNAGTLVNANGRYIKCIGMNQWDEEWESGKLTNGEPVADGSCIRTKNYIKVIPNAQYYLKQPSGYSVYGRLFFYDANKNYVGSLIGSNYANRPFTTPNNAVYMKAYWDGITYNNDISINLYYEDEPRCLTYEPYQVLTNNDTGNEVLRSAGSVKDSKAPDGTIHRLVENYTFTGLEDFGSYEPSPGVTVFYWNGGKTNWKMYGKMIADLADITPVRTGPGSLNNKQMTIDNSQTTPVLYIRDDDCANVSALLSKLNGHSMNVELYQETTEQGTPYSENLVIDDFGSMDFGGTNGVPQGALIFYPVDYKAFVDTLYNYTDGAPSNIALKSDLPTAPQTWAESLPGYDATKTQTLKNVNGVLTWVDDE